MRNLYKYIVVFIGAVTFMGCGNFFDPSPKDQTPEDEMFKDEIGFKDVLTACYVKLNGTDLYGKAMTTTDIEYMAQFWDYGYSTFTYEKLLKDFQYSEPEAALRFENIYGALYNTIAQANSLLKNLESKGGVIRSSALRSIIEAEALSIRAFCHMDILRLFGDQPSDADKSVQLRYVEQLSHSAAKLYGFEKFVEKILIDLNKAEQLFDGNDPVTIPEKEGNSGGYLETDSEDFLSLRRFRFNYYSVQALKARLYLYLGDKDNAAKYALIVKEKSKLELAGSKDYEKGNYATPSECVLALSNHKLRDNTESLFKYNNLYLTDRKLRNDLFSATLTASDSRFILGWNIHHTNQANAVRPIINKYKQPPIDNLPSLLVLMTEKQVIPLLRLSESYLILMETTNDLNRLNELYIEYMAARNVSVTGFSSLENGHAELLKEYRREFFAEGQMFFVYKRLGETRMLWRKDNVEMSNYVVPIPSTEFLEKLN